MKVYNILAVKYGPLQLRMNTEMKYWPQPSPLSENETIFKELNITTSGVTKHPGAENKLGPQLNCLSFINTSQNINSYI